MALAKIMSFINPILLASPQHGPSLADSLSFLLIVPSLFQLLEFHFTASCWLFQSLLKPQPMSSPTSLYPPLFFFSIRVIFIQQTPAQPSKAHFQYPLLPTVFSEGSKNPLFHDVCPHLHFIP